MVSIIEKLTYINNQVKGLKSELSSYGVIGPAAVLSALKPGVQTLKTNLDNKAAEAATVSAALDTLYGQYNDLSIQYGDLSAQYGDLSAQYGDLSAQYDEMSANYSTMSSDYEAADSIIDSILS